MKRCFLLAAGLLLGTGALFSHPHAWISAKASLVVEDGKLKGLWAEWTMDDMFSAILVADYDRNQDGQFTGPELADLRSDYFDNLKNFGFFTKVWRQGKTVPLTEARDFTCSLKGGTAAVYKFFLPLDLKLSAGQEVSVAMYDESFYSDIGWADADPVQVSGRDAARFTFSLGPNKAHRYYNEQITPVEIRLKAGK